MSAPLLETVRTLLERTYRIRSGLEGLGAFVIGDAGYRTLYRTTHVAREVRSADGQGARTLVRETDDGVAACIYFPDAMIHRLEAHPPQHGLCAENLDAFATFVEEIDHLLVIAESSRRRRPVRLFELELHANVSKYLVLARFLAGRSARLAEGPRLWLRRRLFDPARYCDEDPAARARYRDAARWAVRLLEGLATLEASRSVRVLRHFHVADLQTKLRHITELAA